MLEVTCTPRTELLCTLVLQRSYAFWLNELMAELPHGRNTVRLDATQLRALAHPMRMRLLGLLRLDGPATATVLAQRVDTNSGQTSYHLRQLAEAGLVEDAPELGGGRERWWRAVHEGTSWVSTDFVDDPDARAADSFLVGLVLRRHADDLGVWFESRGELSTDWMDASEVSDFWLDIGPTRLREMQHELHEVILRYKNEENTHDPDTRRVTVHLHAFPQPFGGT